MNKKERNILIHIFNMKKLTKSRLFPKGHISGYNSCLRGMNE